MHQSHLDNEKFGELLEVASAALFTDEIQEEASELVAKMSEGADLQTVIAELYEYSRSVSAMTLTNILHAMFTQEEVDEMIESYTNSGATDLVEEVGAWIEKVNSAKELTDNENHLSQDDFLREGRIEEEDIIAAESGDTSAMIRIGEAYKYAFIASKNKKYFEASKNWFIKAAKAGDVNAFEELGFLFIQAEDGKEAKFWFEKAINAGVELPFNIEEVDFNSEEAEDYDKEVDEEGEQFVADQAANNRALREWLPKAEAGDFQAMNRVALAFLREINLSAAFGWYVKAMNVQKSGYPWTYSAAFCAIQLDTLDTFSEILVKAADNGNVDAMFVLKFLVEETGDLESSPSWHKWMSRMDDPKAKQNLVMCINDIIFSVCIKTENWDMIDFLAPKAISLNVPNQSTNAVSNWAISKYVAGDFGSAKDLFLQALERSDQYAEREASFYLSKIFQREGNRKLSRFYEKRCRKAGGYQARYE